jgi:hypothetical protein
MNCILMGAYAISGKNKPGQRKWSSLPHGTWHEDCRLAIRDLKRFRQLEDIWAEELIKHRPDAASANAERIRLRGLLLSGDAIGAYGEPKRIEKLLAHLK